MIIFYSKSGNTKMIAKRVSENFHGLFPKYVDISMMEIPEIDMDRVMEADGYVIGSPDFFGYPAGIVKTLFDQIYDYRNALKGRPCFAFISHGGGGKGAKKLEELCDAVKFNVITPTISVSEQDITKKIEHAIEKNCKAMLKILDKP